MNTEVLGLMTSIKDVASTILKKDVETVSGFNENQLKAIAKQAAEIKRSFLAGEIDEDLKAFFIQQLEASVRNFISTLTGLLMVSIEKLWNGIIEVLQRFIPNY